MNIPLLKTFKKDASMTRYFVQGKQIQLGRQDFKAQGGEASIYVKGSTAYKIYSDPHRTIAYAKLQELSVLTQPKFIRPLNLVLDKQNRPVGYAMRYAGKTHSLCQIFPKAFRIRNNLTLEMTLELVRKLQNGVTYIHRNNILLVDLNELNFLVAQDFRELFFIDVDSYQTPSFPATVLMESVRDRHANKFTTASDFFSFAVVSFQMFVGIHPFKGTYAPLQQSADRLDARMQANISVLHKGVTVPASCLPFSVIPPVYLDWYRAVFEEGKRPAPPDGLHAVLQLTSLASLPSVESTAFIVRELREFDSQIIWHSSSVTVTEKSIYFDGRRLEKPPFDVKVAISPRQRHLIVAFTEDNKLRFRDLTSGRDIQLEFDNAEVMVINERFYIKQHENIFAVDFVELPQNVLAGLRPVANVMARATQVFDGLAIQNLLGTKYASIVTDDGGCHQLRLSELDSHQVVFARIERNVLIVVATQAGSYDKFVYRFARDFSSYKVRSINDISSIDINFTVLDTGVVLHLIDDNKLEVFSSNINSPDVRTLQDPLLETDVRLFHTGKQALIARGPKLCKISLQS
jgi:hypothetical protein